MTSTRTSNHSPQPEHAAAAKQAVVAAAIQQLEAELDLYKQRLGDLKAPLGELGDNPTDRYDGQLSEINDEAELLQAQLSQADADLIRLRQPEFQALYEQVTPGVIVWLDNGLNLIVGINLAPFDMEGTEYRGLTEGAPLYPALQAKRAGDTVDFNGRALVIKAVA